MAVAERKRKTKLPAWGWAASAAGVVAGAALGGYFLGLRWIPGFANRVGEGFSAPARRLLGRICALVPFSVTELLIVLLVLGAAVFLVRTAVRARRRGARTLLRRGLALLLAGALVFSGYCWLYGVEYQGSSFAERAGMTAAGVDAETLAAVTFAFAERAGELAPLVPRDGEGRVSVSARECLTDFETLYDGVEALFPFLTCRSYRPKPLLFSRVMSRMGFTGVYIPFTGESSINVDVPAFTVPFTVAHELAHQRGVVSEQECNFLGVLACVTGGDTLQAYSGTAMGLTYLLDALYRADRDAWAAVWDVLAEPVQADIRQNNTYWQSMESPVTGAAEQVYDAYLVGNGQTMGVRSYGACVDLIVEYFSAVPLK
jgi:hypothetical protein